MRPVLLPLAALLLAAAPFSSKAARAGDPPPPAAPCAALMYGPRFREGKPDQALTKGTTPLLRGQVDAYVDLVEASLDVSLTAEEEQELRDALETAWPSFDAATRATFARRAEEKAAVVAAWRRGDGAAAKRLLDPFAADLESRLSAAPDLPHLRPLAAARRRRDEVFSAGSPPVSLTAQHAFEELVLFLVRVARNEDALVTEGQRAALREGTRQAMDRSGDLVRRRYARMPRLWLLVKARWDAGDEDARLRMRWAAVRAFRWMLGKAPSPDAAAQPGGDLAAYAAAAREVAAAKPAFDEYTLAFQNLEAVLSAAVEGAGFPRGDVEKAFAGEPVTFR